MSRTCFPDEPSVYCSKSWVVSIRTGTDEERGVKKWRKHFSAQEDILSTINDKTYDLPFITGCLRRLKCSAYIPFLPPFKYSIGHLVKRGFSKCKVSCQLELGKVSIIKIFTHAIMSLCP